MVIQDDGGQWPTTYLDIPNLECKLHYGYIFKDVQRIKPFKVEKPTGFLTLTPDELAQIELLQ